jgi:hypothetical protein
MHIAETLVQSQLLLSNYASISRESEVPSLQWNSFSGVQSRLYNIKVELSPSTTVCATSFVFHHYVLFCFTRRCFQGTGVAVSFSVATTDGAVFFSAGARAVYALGTMFYLVYNAGPAITTSNPIAASAIILTKNETCEQNNTHNNYQEAELCHLSKVFAFSLSQRGCG